jgi:photosystem II stability/assembly factor-like uncharacterized protein
MASGVRALVGTRKGLFTLTAGADRRRWRVDGPSLDGWSVYHAVVDPRSGELFAAANHLVYGPTIQRSSDDGRTWTRSTDMPLPQDCGLSLNAVWHLEPGHSSQPQTLFLGGDPGLLFRSDDMGVTWQVNQALLTHRTRGSWVPSAGGLMCHGVQIDSSDPNLMFVSISAGGAFRSVDTGATWIPINKGVEIDMLPDPYPEAGQCVHKLLLHPGRSGRIWQQNHCGVYRSDDYGDSWDRVDGNGLPSAFGFTLMLDPNDPEVAYVIPERSYEYHYTPNRRLSVYKTLNGGKAWDRTDAGLPDQAWAAVMREASAFDSDSVYFGTQSGSFFAMTANDRWWCEGVRHLPPILSVEVAPWSM